LELDDAGLGLDHLRRSVASSSVLIRVIVSAKSRDGSPRRGPKPAFGYLIPTLKTVDGFPCSVARLRHSPSNYQP